MRLTLSQTPYFIRALSDQTRRDQLVDRIVARLQDRISGYEYRYPFLRTIGLFENMLHAIADTEGHNPPLANEIRTLAGLIALKSEHAGIYTPSVMLTVFRDYHAQGRAVPVAFVERTLCAEYTEARDNDRAVLGDFLEGFAESFYCEDCGDRHVMQNSHRDRHDNLICTGCIEENYTWSDYYDTYIHTDSARNAIDRDGDEVVIDENDNNFIYDEESEDYIHRDRQRQRSPIRSYHSSKDHFAAIADDWSRRHDRFFGVELEVEAHRIDRNTAARNINEIVNEGEIGRRVFFEQDGSLSNGFEIITQPMSLPMIRETFEFLKNNAATNGLRSHRTSTCGLHVHVSRTGLSNLTIARAVTFVNDPRNDIFITALARRYDVQFCKIHEKDLATAYVSRDRYEAINLTPRATIEFRIFRGSLKYEAVIAAVEFCHALLEFCARANFTTTPMTPTAFLSWCAESLTSETQTMREYIEQRTAGTFTAVEAA